VSCIPIDDLGHVFHEPCIKDWFQAQSAQYLAQAREHRLDRDPSPTLSDAPVLCPTCRTECFADPETGEPALHRLYINYGDEAGSSQFGSSPVRASTQSRRRETEIMGFARRAKGITEDMKGLNDRSSQQAVDGILSRAEGLRDDAVSAKAIQGVKVNLIWFVERKQWSSRILDLHRGSDDSHQQFALHSSPEPSARNVTGAY
jgi:hypothetical protein